jgi:hypothetical protein
VRPLPQGPSMLPAWRRFLPIALGLVLCASSGVDVLASPSSSARSNPAITSGHECACPRCSGGGTCCCSHRKTRAKPTTPSSDSDERLAIVRPGPCLDAAPCGDPILPYQGVRIYVKPIALMAESVGRVITPGGRWQPSTEALSFTSPFAARLDDPPEVSRCASA